LRSSAAVIHTNLKSSWTTAGPSSSSRSLTTRPLSTCSSVASSATNSMPKFLTTHGSRTDSARIRRPSRTQFWMSSVRSPPQSKIRPSSPAWHPASTNSRTPLTRTRASEPADRWTVVHNSNMGKPTRQVREKLPVQPSEVRRLRRSTTNVEVSLKNLLNRCSASESDQRAENRRDWVAKQRQNTRICSRRRSALRDRARFRKRSRET